VAFSESTIAILKYAAQREMETHDFYASCLAKATISGTKEILQTLVRDEKRHYDIVTGILQEGGAAGAMKELIDTPDAKSQLTRALSHSKVTGEEFSAEHASVHDLLVRALEIEKESFTTYSQGFEEAGDSETKAVFKFLAGEENKHYIMIDNLMSFLDNPGTWLYEEENLIFRR
jgi:rubrerythrin